MYYIVLSNEQDYFKHLGENMWRSTTDISNATQFKTIEEATEILNNLEIKSIWNEAHVETE